MEGLVQVALQMLFSQARTLLLGGSCDLVTIHNWVITLLIIGVTPIRSFRGVVSRVIRPVMSSYYFP